MGVMPLKKFTVFLSVFETGSLVREKLADQARLALLSSKPRKRAVSASTLLALKCTSP